MTTDNFCFYLKKKLIQTSQTGGQQYSDTSPFSIPSINIGPMYLHHKTLCKLYRFKVAEQIFTIIKLSSLLKEPMN
jgi:hypothetical protein